jgi:hypothetical protein
VGSHIPCGSNNEAPRDPLQQRRILGMILGEVLDMLDEEMDWLDCDGDDDDDDEALTEVKHKGRRSQ